MSIFEAAGDAQSVKEGVDVAARYNKDYEAQRNQPPVRKRVHQRRHLNPIFKQKAKEVIDPAVPVVKELTKKTKNAAIRGVAIGAITASSVAGGMELEERANSTNSNNSGEGAKITVVRRSQQIRPPHGIYESHHRQQHESPKTSPDAPKQQEVKPQTPPKKEKKTDIRDIRADLVNKVLYGVSDSEFMKINGQIEKEMKGRELDNIEKIWQEYGDYIKMEAKEFGVPEWVIFGMIGTESRFDPNADPPDSDAVGIAQITIPAGVDMGIVDEERGMDLRDYPPSAIRGLSLYVSKYRSYFGGDLAYGIQTYKTGPGHLMEYAEKVTGKATPRDAARARSVYGVIQNVKPHDEHDKTYLARVIGHGAELQSFLETKNTS